MEKNGRFRNWLFTDFCDCCCLRFCGKDDTRVKYYIYQKEIAPTTGKVHYQGYIEFNEGLTLKNVSEYFDCRVHLERRRGTQEQAIDYCSKLETRDKNFPVVEYGNKKNQGQRSDLDNIHESIMNGLTPAQILIVHGGHAVKYMHMINTAIRELWNTPDSLTMQMKEQRKNMNQLKNISKTNMDDILKYMNED